MRVLIVTSGSTGDVAPYTGLGTALRDAGHQVTIATHAPFHHQISACGLDFTPIPGDLREILPQARGQDGTTSGTGPRALLRLLSLARPLIASLAAGVAAAVDSVRPDALLLSTLVAPLGYQVAEAYRLPRAGVFLQPLYPTAEFGSVLTGGRSLGPWPNRTLAALASRTIEPLYAGPIRDLRSTLGLPRVPLAELRRTQEHNAPTFHGFSPAVVPRPADWPTSLRVTGYWWPARPMGWQPPPDLVDFLATGPPPVFIGFGSMAPGQGARLASVVSAALRRTGLRAVVQAGWSDLTAEGDNIHAIGSLPHDWLFPQMAAVVHHSGAGTTAAGIRAGVPAVPVPVLADQPFWANRLHRLGIAPPPLPMRSLTPETLATALEAVTTNPHFSARAQALSARVSAEDGTAEIRAWLREHE